jgi:hypothetical protein
MGSVLILPSVGSYDNLVHSQGRKLIMIVRVGVIILSIEIHIVNFLLKIKSLLCMRTHVPTHSLLVLMLHLAL